MPTVSDQNSLEVARYPLTDLEKDALNHFPAKVSLRLIKTLRDSVAVFHVLAHDLWRSGVRIRIVPRGKCYCDIAELAIKDPDYGTDVPGLYLIESKLVVVREEALLFSTSMSLKYATFIHEMAHAVWFCLLWQNDRDYVNHLYEQEKQRRSKDPAYRMQDVFEFFAESFVYYVTPYRRGKLLRITERSLSGKKVLREADDPDQNHEDKETLKHCNFDMLMFLESKFKNVIDPELVTSKPKNQWKEMRFERWDDEQLFLPVTHSTSSDDEEPIYNW